MPGPHPDGDLGVRVSLAIVAVASRIVPSAARSEWLREWNAEVWHRRDRLSRWAVFDTAARVRLVRTCLGAYADALCMRKLASPDADTLDDILCGARRLAESPQRSLAAAVTLASALAVMTTVLALALPSLRGHADVADAGRLAYVRNTYSLVDRPWMPVSADEYGVFRRQTAVFEDAAASYVRQGVITRADRNFPATIATVSPNFFDVLRTRPFMGEVAAGRSGRSAALGYELWRSRFGSDTGILGTEISIGAETLTVVAVLPPGFDVPVAADVWCPRDVAGAPPAEGGPDTRFLDVVGRLKPGITHAAAQAAMSELSAQLRPGGHDAGAPRWGISVTPFEAGLVSDATAPNLALIGAAAALVALACVSSARWISASSNRAREPMWTELRRRSTQGVLIAACGAVAGLGVAVAARPWLSLAAAGLVGGREVMIEPRIVWTLASIGLVCGLVVGIVPGLARVMRMLPRVQAALAVALVVGACAAGVHAVRARSVNSGIDTTRRLTYRLALDADGNDRVAAYDLALERARGIRGVEQAAAIDALPVDGAGHNRSLVVERAAGRAHTDHACRSVSPSYFDVMGIPVLSGRSFTVRDGANDPAVAVVNDAFARRYWPDELAAGHRVGLASASGVRWLTVVGVVGNVREGGRDDAPRPEVYAPFPQLPARSLCIVATAAYGAEPAVSAGVATLEAERLSTDVRRLADVVDRPVARQTGFAVALGVLACIALGLVASGMIGGPSGGRGRVPV